ncbi:MAG: hypothetical protein K6E34_06750 [Lachnospiraceae bacterium]|nr:hypothetical protein [Lachnospiraceae bacterium]
MRLKSYLKGLGLGIFITALILSLGSKKNGNDLSDDEIRERAAKLGMVSENSMLLADAQTLADNAQKKAMASVSSENASVSSQKAKENSTAGSLPKGTVSEGSVSDNGEIIYEKAEKKPLSENKTAKASEKEDAAGTAGTQKAEKSDTVPKDTASADAENENSENKTSENKTSRSSEVVNITVNSGESSISVATKMAEAGLVSDAHQFDSYLVLSGYDRRLVVGTHPIPKGSSPAEMGELITSRQ